MKIDPEALDVRGAHELFVGAIVPRPIALVSTIGEDGIYNVAPFSFFSLVALKPAIAGLQIGWHRDGRKKDTQLNIESAGDFVINVVTEALAEAMNQTSGNYPSQVDEFKEAGLTPVKSDLVKSPMVAESPVNMECRLMQISDFGEAPGKMTFITGQIIRVHVKDELWDKAKGTIKIPELKAIARLSEDYYCRTRDIFEMKRPDVQ